MEAFFYSNLHFTVKGAQNCNGKVEYDTKREGGRKISVQVGMVSCKRF